ncbi:hypothetical protein ABBQ32_005474 [Trebouxia sp. C0010 RCD-2024]
MLSVTKQLEEIYVSQRVDDLDQLLSGKITLHKDSITLGADLQGIDNLKKYYQAFFKKYDYKHEVLCLAADGPSSVSFSFVADTAQPKDGVFTNLEEKETAPSRCLSIFMYTFNTDGKITDIKFLRQPSKDEMARKFVTSPDYSSIPKFVGPEFSDPKYWEPSAETTKRLHTAAASFHEIWKNGDASIADKILDKDVKDYNLMFGGEPKVGSDAFKSMINGVIKVWKPDQVKCSIAVTSDSNKAFIYWASHGEQTDTHQENHFYGLNLLVFNEKCVVTEILGFRQPLASERPQFLKADAKAAAK